MTTFPNFLALVLALAVFRPPLDAAAAPSTEELARDILQKASQDKNPDVRKQAAVSLSLGGPREPFLSELEAMLADKDVEVRLAAISSLSDLKTRRTTAALRKALNDDVPEVSFAAAKALYNANDPAGKQALFSVLSGETKASSGFLTKQKREALRMTHTPKTMFMFALKAGAGLAPVPGLGEGISSMQGILADPSVSGRAMAALLLAKEKDPATLAALREALVDKDASVRAAAVHALALRNESNLQKDLVPLLDDKKEAVRLRAAAGYLRLQLIRGTRPKPPAGNVAAPQAPKK
jgi:HEAT repeat protein